MKSLSYEGWFDTVVSKYEHVKLSANAFCSAFYY